MKSRENVYSIPLFEMREQGFDFETFVDRMHVGAIAARGAYEIFRSHGSAPVAELEENWTEAELERLGWYKRRAA